MLIFYFRKGHGFTLCKNLSFNKNLVQIQHIILNFDNLLQNLRGKKSQGQNFHFFLPYVESLSEFPKAFLQDSKFLSTLTTNIYYR